jgi:hypothetical protein
LETKVGNGTGSDWQGSHEHQGRTGQNRRDHIPPRRTHLILRDPLKLLKEAKAELAQELAFEARS